jgi:hypothetical protein
VLALSIDSALGERMDAAGSIILLLALYFLPALVALGRRVKRAGAIFLLNLLLGWTVLGWIGALIWAVADSKEDAWVPPQFRDKPCPRCAETVKAAAAVCRYCGYDFGSLQPETSPASPRDIRCS